MDVLSRYWKICRLSLAHPKGYEIALLAIAREFLAAEFPDLEGDRAIQSTLYSRFREKDSAVAGLCLRCYVSHPILKACQRIASLFSADKCFTYRDLLAFVLNDDGKVLLLLDEDGKSQLILDERGIARTSDYKYFTVEVLRSYQADSQARMSLDNWAYLQTRQNKEVKNFLSEFGFKHLSDWALLNRVSDKQLERLSERDRALVRVFHAVYRRDRRKQRQKGAKKCPDPNETQLQEMGVLLPKTAIASYSSAELLKALKQVAQQIRQYDIWSARESLEVYDPDTGGYAPRRDLPQEASNDLGNVERQEFLAFLRDSLETALNNAIAREISDRLEKLQKSKAYQAFAPYFIPGLQRYYSQGKSLGEIASELGISSWDRARRVFNPGEILAKVRTLTVEQLLDEILTKATEMGLTEVPPAPDYLKTLAQQVEAFADEEIFQEATSEIKAGKNRSFKSLYAEKLRNYLETHP